MGRQSAFSEGVGAGGSVSSFWMQCAMAGNTRRQEKFTRGCVRWTHRSSVRHSIELSTCSSNLVWSYPPNQGTMKPTMKSQPPIRTITLCVVAVVSSRKYRTMLCKVWRTKCERITAFKSRHRIWCFQGYAPLVSRFRDDRCQSPTSVLQ